MVSVICTAKYKQLIICTVYCTVQYSLAQAHFANQIMSMQNTYTAKLMLVQETLEVDKMARGWGVGARFAIYRVFRGN
jgi:hypothetical protein